MTTSAQETNASQKQLDARAEAHPDTTVALAYIDMGQYELTRAALEALRPSLMPGSVILLDVYSWPDAKGEAIASREVFGTGAYRIEQSAVAPKRPIVTIC